MATTYVTGPVHHFVAFPYNPTQAYYLGTAEVAPKLRFRRGLKPVFNDLGGQLMPFERICQGEEAQIVTPLNRYNESVYKLISAFPRVGRTGTQLRGLNGPLDVGAKMVANGCYFTLILQFPFAGTDNSPSAEEMPPYYVFPACQSEQDDFESMGTDQFKKLLAITAVRVYTPLISGGSTGLGGGFLLYTNTLSSITLPTPD